MGMKCLGKIDEAGLVGHGQQGAADLDGIGHEAGFPGEWLFARALRTAGPRGQGRGRFPGRGLGGAVKER